MNYIKYVVTHYPVSLVLITATWILCFMSVPVTPLHKYTLMDKWTHIAMFAAICLAICHEHRNCHKGENTNWIHLTTWAWLMPFAMGGAIELLQAYCTGGRRAGDWLDVIANGIGCVIGFLAGAVITWGKTRKSNDA